MVKHRPCHLLLHCSCILRLKQLYVTAEGTRGAHVPAPSGLGFRSPGCEPKPVRFFFPQDGGMLSGHELGSRSQRSLSRLLLCPGFTVRIRIRRSERFGTLVRLLHTNPTPLSILPLCIRCSTVSNIEA